MTKAAMAEHGAMSAQEAAAFLGVSQSTIYILRKSGALSYAVVAGKFVFPRAVLQEYLKTRIRQGRVA